MANAEKETVTTDINFLEIPIFDVSSSPKDKEITYTKKYRNRYGKTDKVTITSKSKLTGFDRKILYAIEFLYLKQNENFETEYVVTTIRQIERVLGYKNFTASHKIVNSLRKLFNINIEAIIYEKKEDGKVTPSTNLFHFFYHLEFDQNIYSKLKKITKIKIRLNDFHINNFKNKYYRLLNFSLIKSLKKNISIRFFDYLNFTSYKLDKDGRYRQYTKRKLRYKDICDYLNIKQETTISKVRQQLEPSLQELQDKTVIKEYELEKDLFDNIWLNLRLNKSINLWSKYSPRIKELDNVEVLTPTQQKLKSKGLSLKQVKNITSRYEESYITSKLEQVEYLFHNMSYKVKGVGSYLYNSLKNNWIDEDYRNYVEDKKQNELQLLTTYKEKVHEKQVEQYEKYISEVCLHWYHSKASKEVKETIDKQVKDILDKNRFIKTNKSIEELYRQSTIIKVITENRDTLHIQLLSFKDYLKENY